MNDQQGRPCERSPRAPRSWLRRRLRPVVLAALAVPLAAGGGWATGYVDPVARPAAASSLSQAATSAASPSPAATSVATPGGTARKQKAAKAARVTWTRTYGQDRKTMPAQPDVAAATPDQQAAARDLLARTEAATAPFADLAAARAAGYDLSASLARAETKRPRLAKQMKKVDNGSWPAGKATPMLHVRNDAYNTDGKVLDPSAPETLMYSYQGQGAWKLIGVMYSAAEAFPQAPPVPGGPITRWHYHETGAGLMMHVFFVPGNDLARAFATTMSD